MSTPNTTRLPGCSVMPAMKPLQERKLESPKGTAKDKSKRTAVTSNRFRELNAFVDYSMTDLSRAELGTWLVLWRDTKNGTARTSMTDVARRIGVTRRAVVDAVTKLEQRGLLTVVYRGGMRRGMNVYRVQTTSKPPD